MKIIDLSIALEEGLPSDPPITRPEIERWSHEQGTENMLSFFPKATKKDLSTVIYDENTPYFEECTLTINCKRIMDTQFLENDFHGNEAYLNKYYGGENQASGEGGGYHHLYIAEIDKILVKK